MNNLKKQVKELIQEHGLLNIVQVLVEDFDNKADFSHLSGDKKGEDSYRRVAIILFDALRKIDSV